MIGVMPQPVADRTLRQVWLFASATSAAASVIAPAGIQKGDLMVLIDAPESAGAINTASVPAGFTQFRDVPPTGWETKVVMSYKIADGTEGGATITGMTGTVENAKVLLVFRGKARITGMTMVSQQYDVSNGDPSGVVANFAAYTPAASPVIALGTVQCRGATPPAFQTQSPAFAASLTGGHLRVGYTIYDKAAALSNQTVDLNDNGLGNLVTVCGLVIA